MKKKILWLVVAVVSASLVTGLLIFRMSLYGTNREPGKLIEIPPHFNAKQVTVLLYKENIIRNPGYFLYLVRENRYDERLNAGIYEFTIRPYIGDVLKMLIRGEIARFKIMVPEGSTCNDIGEFLEDHQIAAKDEFNAFCAKEKLEGYLFPDTYDFPVRISKEAVAKRMTERFWNEIKNIYPDYGSLTKQQLKRFIIIASIVEKEAETDTDRPIIAGIFYNRLRKGIPLQSCATIKYFIGNKKNLTLSDIKIRSPYNTYIHRGLPPGSYMQSRTCLT